MKNDSKIKNWSSKITYRQPPAMSKLYSNKWSHKFLPYSPAFIMYSLIQSTIQSWNNIYWVPTVCQAAFDALCSTNTTTYSVAPTGTLFISSFLSPHSLILNYQQVLFILSPINSAHPHAESFDPGCHQHPLPNLSLHLNCNLP